MRLLKSILIYRIMIFYKKKFKSILEKKGYASSSIESYIRRLEHYENWCKQPKNSKYTNNKKLAFEYLKQLKKKTSNSRTLNRELQPLKLYYRLCRKTNPFEFLYINQVQESIIKTNLLSKEELDGIYDSFKQNTLFEKEIKCYWGSIFFKE